MIGFLIFYFVFSAIFTIGVIVREEDNISSDEFIVGMLLGWLLLPFGLGTLVGNFNKSKKNE